MRSSRRLITATSTVCGFPGCSLLSRAKGEIPRLRCLSAAPLGMTRCDAHDLPLGMTGWDALCHFERSERRDALCHFERSERSERSREISRKAPRALAKAAVRQTDDGRPEHPGARLSLHDSFPCSCHSFVNCLQEPHKLVELPRRYVWAEVGTWSKSMWARSAAKKCARPSP